MSTGNQHAYGFVIDEVFSRVPDKITAGSVLKGVLPVVHELLSGEWSTETRLSIQARIDDVLRQMNLI